MNYNFKKLLALINKIRYNHIMNKKIDTTQNFKRLKRNKFGRFLPKQVTFATFIYPDSKNPALFKIRKVLVREKNKNYIKGYQLNDNNQFKSFFCKKAKYMLLEKEKFNNNYLEFFNN